MNRRLSLVIPQPPVITHRFYVDLPYKWSTETHTLAECLIEDCSAFGIGVEVNDRGKTEEGWPVYRFSCLNYFYLVTFRDTCCKALGWPSHMWRIIEREEVR